MKSPHPACRGAELSRAFLGSLLCAFAYVGCRAPPPPAADASGLDPSGAAAASPPSVALYGQRTRLDGRACFDAEHPLRLRVEAAAGDFEVRWDSARLDAAQVVREDGVLLTPAAPPVGDARLTVALAGVEIGGWPVRWGPTPGEHPGIAPAVALRKGGDPAAAAAWLEARLAALDPAVAYHGWFELGRARRQLDDPEGTHAAWNRALELALARGDRGFAGAAQRSLIWLSTWRRDLAAAHTHIEQAAALLAGEDDVEGTIKLDINRALVETESGNYAAARRHLDAVRAEAWRYGLDRSVATVDILRTTVLGALHRYDEALALELDGRDGGALNNRGWLLLEAMEAGAVPVDYGRVEQLFRQALATFRAEGARGFAAITGANLAWLALRRGDRAAARRHLDEDGAGIEEGQAAQFAALVRAELAAAEGHAEQALALYGQVEDDPYEPRGWDLRWRAALGQARLHRAAGRDEAALGAYGRALDRLDEVGRGTGVREDRARFFGDRRALVDEAIEALLAAGRVEAAFVVADRARVRVLRALEAGMRVGRLSPGDRARWLESRRAYADAVAELEALRDRARRTWRPSEQAGLDARAAALVERRAEAFERSWALLARGAPSDGDVPVDPAALVARLGPDAALLAIRRRGDGVDAFWVRGGPQGGVEHRFTTGDLLAPWAEALPGLSRLHLVVPATEQAQRIEAHPIDGAPLGARLVVSRIPYAGLLTIERRGAVAGEPVVVADGRLDLPEAEREGRWVHARLGGQLLAGAAATPAAVGEALDGARLFHFAGHGDLRADSPWDAHLRLAGEGRLTLESVLFERPRAGLVVLSGCETGARLDVAGGEVIGLPEAFLVTGSDAVLVTRRPVADAEAKRFVQAFYGADGARDPGRGLLAARRHLHAAGDPVWAAFELWSR